MTKENNTNPPGLKQLAYRIGTHPTFFAKMREQIRSESLLTEDGRKIRPLANLRIRDKNDPAIALLDAWSMALDVLTFYQERIANEGYLKTAIEKRSLLELGRVVGYSLSPGLAAGTYLSFTLNQNDTSPQEVKIPKGLQVSSIPKHKSSLPLIFETQEDFTARVEWNDMKPLFPTPKPDIITSKPDEKSGLIQGEQEESPPEEPEQAPSVGTASFYLKGVSNDLEPGDRLLILGKGPQKEWYSAVVQATEFDHPQNRTLVHWTTRNSQGAFPADYEVYVFRKRISLFGHHPEDWHDLPNQTKLKFLLQEEITAVVAHGSTLWAGTSSGRIFRNQKQSQWSLWNIPGITTAITGLASNSANLLAAGTIGDGLFLSKDGGENWYQGQNGLLEKEIQGLRFDFAGNLYAKTPKGVFVRGKENSAEWKAISPEDRVPSFQEETKGINLLLSGRVGDHWPQDYIREDNMVDLDAEYPNLLEKSWILLERDGVDSALLKIQKTSTVFRRDFGISGKITRLEIAETFGSAYVPASFRLQDTLVFALSEKLEPVLSAATLEATSQTTSKQDAMLLDSLLKEEWAKTIPSAEFTTRLNQEILKRLQESHQEGLGDDPEKMFSALEKLKDSVTATPGWEKNDLKDASIKSEEERVLHQQDDWLEPGGQIDEKKEKKNILFSSRLPQQEGITTLLSVKKDLKLQKGQAILLKGKNAQGQRCQEMVHLEKTVEEENQTRLFFQEPIQHNYLLDSLSLNANLVYSTHGETIQNEILGSGDTTLANQSFFLKRHPLTYLSVHQSTLEVRVNHVLWTEVPSLLEVDESSRSYMLRTDEQGRTKVIFGDGINGARLPSGRENVSATYRIGSGSGDLPSSNCLTLLPKPPLGVDTVTNPFAVQGGVDPENFAQLAEHLSEKEAFHHRILTLSDYSHFAATFPGISKAQAVRFSTPAGPLVHITLAGKEGKEVPESSQIVTELSRELQRRSLPGQKLQLQSYLPCYFGFEATISTEPGFAPEEVKHKVQQLLWEAFSFEKRKFGQEVEESDLVSLIQKVPGVLFVSFQGFLSGKRTKQRSLPAQKARWDQEKEIPQPAELLLLDSTQSEIRVTMNQSSLA